jgi:hypothetical protein
MIAIIGETTVVFKPQLKERRKNVGKNDHGREINIESILTGTGYKNLCWIHQGKGPVVDFVSAEMETSIYQRTKTFLPITRTPYKEKTSC